MRRSVSIGAIAAALVLLAPAWASAKGSTLRFDEAAYRPGDRAVGRAVVETWPGSGGPLDGPYTVYLVRGGQPLWFGHLPNDALTVGELRIGDALPRDRYRVTVAFEVPRVPAGRYSVWVCRKECGANSAFGDLVAGGLYVTGAIAYHPLPGFPPSPSSSRPGPRAASTRSWPLDTSVHPIRRRPSRARTTGSPCSRAHRPARCVTR